MIKVSKTACEEFNRKIFALLDPVKDMEYKYKMTDPGKMTKDPGYSKYRPYALLLNIQQVYSRLLSFQDWPALATKLPQSNNASTSASNIKVLDGGSSSVRKCFCCGAVDHHIRDCPKKEKNKDTDKDKEKSNSKDDSDAPAAKKVKSDLPAWRYLEPKDLKSTLVDDGRTWKFCTKCKCKKTGRLGLYILSHSDADHVDNWTPKSEGNLASVDVPLNVPEATVAAASLFDPDDDIEFQGLGAWCASVDPTGIKFVPSTVEREMDEGCAGCDSSWPTFCLECGTDWDPAWTSDYEDWILTTKCLWPASKSLLSEKALIFLRNIEPPGDPEDVFMNADECEPEPVYYKGIAFYDPAPDETLTLANIQTLTHFLRPKPGWFDMKLFHQLMLWSFLWTTVLWDALTYLLIANGVGPTS